MAITLIGTAEGSAADGGDATIDLTPLGLAENDVVVVGGGHTLGNQAAGVSTSGYSEVLDVGSLTRLSVSWKRMGISPDTEVVCTGNGDADRACAYVVMAFRGVDTTTAIDQTSTSATGLSGAPNSPSITTVTDGAAVLSFGVARTDDTAVTAPSGYTGQVDISISETDASTTACGAYLIVATAGAENPAAWTDFNSSPWTAGTVALRPATGGSVQSGVLSATGTATVSFISGTESVLSISGTITTGFIAAPLTNATFALTGNTVTAWVGDSLSTNQGQLSVSATGTASFVGDIEGSGDLSAPCSVTATFVGASFSDATGEFSGTVFVSLATDRTFLSHVVETIESKGAATVNIG